MDYFIPLPETFPSFSNSTLILPQPSLGSVAQLAADLIITTLELQLIGYLNPKDYVPSLSGKDSRPGQPAQEGICYGVEVFQSKSKDLVVILPRSPVIRARKREHCEAMKKFIEGAKFTQVLIVSGVDADTREDAALRAVTPLRHFILSHSPLSANLERLTPPYAADFTSTVESGKELPHFPSAGLTRNLLSTFSSPLIKIPISTLLIYATEGDNSGSAFYLADLIAEVLELKKGEGEWITPSSWQKGLMGEHLTKAQSSEMYG